MVAFFAFLFGAFFHMTDYINMWWSVTTAIFTGGAGAAIIGGLYWKKGTAAGAWAAFLTGSILSIGGIVVQQVEAHAHVFFFGLNGIQIAFFSCLIAIAVYVVVSMVTSREDFNLDRMLHRGAYAMSLPQDPGTPERKVGWGKLIGIDKNFTVKDKWVAGTLLGWTATWFVLFLVITAWNLASPWSMERWTSYWHIVGIGLPIFLAVMTGIWFTWGGVVDLRNLFRLLGRERVNSLDDGTVAGHQNRGE